jgi:hypothetical protein
MQRIPEISDMETIKQSSDAFLRNMLDAFCVVGA